MKHANARIVISTPFILDLMKATWPHIEFVGTPYILPESDCIGFNMYIPHFPLLKEGDEIPIYKPENITKSG